MDFSYQIDDEIKLTLLTERNAEEFYLVVRENLEQLKIWLPWAEDNYSLELAKRSIWQNLMEFTQSKGFSAIIIYRGKIAGEIGFHDVDLTSKSTQVNYWLAAEAQGRGVMTKSCRALINHAFEGMGLNRIEIDCQAENLKSRAVPERLGFQLEGIRRQAAWLNDRFIDLAQYAILSQEWKNQLSIGD